jgi:hypothetical protein
VPAPFFVTARLAALPFCKTPANVPSCPLAPRVKINVPPALLVTVPFPARAPMMSLKPCRSNVALSVTSDVPGTALAAPSRSVPALTVVAPL